MLRSFWGINGLPVEMLRTPTSDAAVAAERLRPSWAWAAAEAKARCQHCGLYCSVGTAQYWHQFATAFETLLTSDDSRTML